MKARALGLMLESGLQLPLVFVGLPDWRILKSLVGAPQSAAAWSRDLILEGFSWVLAHPVLFLIWWLYLAVVTVSLFSWWVRRYGWSRDEAADIEEEAEYWRKFNEKDKGGDDDGERK